MQRSKKSQKWQNILRELKQQRLKDTERFIKRRLVKNQKQKICLEVVRRHGKEKIKESFKKKIFRRICKTTENKKKAKNKRRL